MEKEGAVLVVVVAAAGVPVKLGDSSKSEISAAPRNSQILFNIDLEVEIKVLTIMVIVDSLDADIGLLSSPLLSSS